MCRQPVMTFVPMSYAVEYLRVAIFTKQVEGGET